MQKVKAKLNISLVYYRYAGGYSLLSASCWRRQQHAKKGQGSHFFPSIDCVLWLHFQPLSCDLYYSYTCLKSLVDGSVQLQEMSCTLEPVAVLSNSIL